MFEELHITVFLLIAQIQVPQGNSNLGLSSTTFTDYYYKISIFLEKMKMLSTCLKREARCIVDSFDCKIEVSTMAPLHCIETL